MFSGSSQDGVKTLSTLSLSHWKQLKTPERKHGAALWGLWKENGSKRNRTSSEAKLLVSFPLIFFSLVFPSLDSKAAWNLDYALDEDEAPFNSGWRSYMAPVLHMAKKTYGVSCVRAWISFMSGNAKWYSHSVKQSAVSYKVKPPLITGSSSPTPRHLRGEIKISSYRALYKNVIAALFIVTKNRKPCGLDKQSMIHPYNGILLSNP